MFYPTLFKRTSTGAVQIWKRETEDGRYRSISGQKDGLQVTSGWTETTAKNVGKTVLKGAPPLFELAKRIEAGLFAEEKLNGTKKLSAKMHRELEWIAEDGRRTATVGAKKPTKCLHLAKSSFEELLASSHVTAAKILYQLCRVLSRRLARTSRAN